MRMITMAMRTVAAIMIFGFMIQSFLTHLQRERGKKGNLFITGLEATRHSYVPIVVTSIFFTIDTEHFFWVEEELLCMSTLVTGPFSMPTVFIGCLTPLYGAPDTNTGFILLSHKIEAELKILFKDF